MAAMTTVLTEFSDSGNRRVYTRSGHSASLPALVIQTRKVAEGNQVMTESKISVVRGVNDSNGDAIAQKVTFEATVRYPLSTQSADITSELAVFRDIIAGDEFTNTVSTQEWLS